MQDALKFFALLSPQPEAWLWSIGIERAICQGETVCTEGEDTDGLDVVLSGLFAVHVDGPRRPPVANLGPGELIGEVSLVENRTATATVVAAEASRVVFLPNAELLLYVATDSVAGADFYRGLATILPSRLRLRSAALASEEGKLADIPGWSNIASAVNELKEALRLADEAAGHSAKQIPSNCIRAVESAFREFTRQVSGIRRQRSGYLPAAEAALNRELISYIHLTQFTRRMLVKSRGYAGDFLTIDYIYSNLPAGIEPLGAPIDRLFLEAPTCRAVRNRRCLLTDIIVQDAAERGSLEVTSLACGSAAEMFDTFAAYPKALIQATLIDVDFEALALASERRTAAGLTKKMRLEHANLVHLSTGRRALNLLNQELIYSIGLIDYFEDRFVIALLNWIHCSLKEADRVILGKFTSAIRIGPRWISYLIGSISTVPRTI